MKWSLLINQKAVIDKKVEIDVVDCCIVDFIVNFVHSERIHREHSDGKTWYWISYKLVIEQLPIINIKTKNAIYKRFVKLQELGLIEAHPDNMETGKPMFAITQKLLDITYGFKSEPSDDGNGGLMTEESAPTDDGQTPPSDQKKTNTTISKDNTISDNSTTDKEIAEPEVQPSEKSDSKPEKNVLYHNCIEIYDEFCLSKESGIGAPAKIDAVQGSAMKKIITYLRKVAKGQGEEDEKVLVAWKVILGNWSKLDDYHKKQVKLTQINSNMLNIIAQIKAHGKGKNGTNRQDRAQGVSDLKDKAAKA